MARVHILSKAATDAGTYSGGSWEAGLPLSNMQTLWPVHVARSTDALATSTRFVVDLLQSAQVSMFALIQHNLSLDATVRFRVSSNSSGTSPTLDATIEPEANVVFGALPWGEFPWNGQDPTYEAGAALKIYRAATAATGRYVLVDIEDEGNADGYVEIGRFMAGQPFVPSINMAYGAQMRFVDDTRSSRSIGGQIYFDQKPIRRALDVSFPALTEGEAYGAVYDIARQGRSGPILISYDPDDEPATLIRRTIYGTPTEPTPIVTANEDTAFPHTYQTTIEEVL